MEAFWAITLIIVSIRLYWKHSSDSEPRDKYKYQPPVTGNGGFETPVVTEQALNDNKQTKAKREAREAQKIVERQRERDIAELRKQGYTDELIAVVLPTINNGE